MSGYTYSIFDANPNESGSPAWPSHADEEIEDVESLADAVAHVRDVMETEAAGLNPSDGYGLGQTLYALIWHDGGTETVTYSITAEDLELGGKETAGWETTASYVSTFADDSPDGEGACDVEVQIGCGDDGRWYLRTTDDAGGSDDCDDTAYDTEEAAREAAAAFADAEHEALEGEGAEDYLARKLEERAGEKSDDGAWCVWWYSAIREDEGPRECYETEEQAEAACEISNAALHATNPGQLLCGFEVRQWVDGEWIGGVS